MAPADLLVASRPSFSLLDAPGVLWTPQDERWLNGVSTEPDQCFVPLDIDDAGAGDFPFWWECQPSTGVSAASVLTTKIIDDGRDAIDVDSFTLWAGHQCSNLDVHSQSRREEIERKLRRKLEAVTRIAVEREFWTGQVASRADFANHWLQEQPMTVSVNGGARTGFVTALAELEQELADNGNLVGRTYIHAQPRVVTAWRSRGLVDVSPDGTYLRTALGTIVVPGVGYSGGGPGDEGSEGSMVGSWAYGTGPVRVAVSEPTLPMWSAETVDRPNNDREVRVERQVAIVWDPCVKVAVHVNPCDEYCGTGS